MSDYVYGNQQETFGARDGRPPGDPEKVVKGAQLDSEFEELTTISAQKLDVAEPTFTGNLNGGTVSGGTY